MALQIGWVDDSGTPVMSQRTASGDQTPTTSIKALAAIMESKHSFSNSTGTVWAWSFPMSSSDPVPGQSTSFIWGVNKNDNPASSPSSSIKRHTNYGTLTLDLTKPYTPASSSSGSGSGSSAPVTPGTATQSESNRVLSRSNQLIIVHMVFMIAAWFILVPAAILIGRYGRTFFKWFPVHRAITISAFVLVLIGFIVIVVQTSQSGSPHFSSTHGRVGLAVFIVMFLQILLGIAGHHTKRFNPSRIVHVIISLGLTGVAIWNSTQGFELWSWGPPRWASWILWIWAGLLVVAYLAGLALLPRDLRQWRQGEKTPEEKQEYLGLRQKTSPGTSTQQHSPGEQYQAHPGWGVPPLQNVPSRAYRSYAQPATSPQAPGNRI